MANWSLKKKHDDLNDEQVLAIQAEIKERLCSLRAEVAQMQTDAQMVQQAVNEHRALMIAQDNVISSLENRIKELSRSQNISVRAKLMRLVSINTYVTGLLDSNYS